jgi:hypothetical protein
MPKKREIEFVLNDKGCHICISHKPNGDGYPYNNYKGKLWRTSRLIYTQHFGDIPKGLIVRHKCDNRLCINPEHLELGTITDNNRDRAKRGRNRNQNGSNNNMVKLTDEQVIEILLSKKSDTKTAKDYNVSQTLVSGIKRREKWRHITQQEIDKYSNNITHPENQ